MSKFWGAGNENESSGSGSSAEETSDVEEQPQKEQPKKRQAWANVSDGSESEEEAKRVVRSQKDKRWDTLRDCVTKMSQHQKNQDFVEVEEDFETLMKNIVKSQKILDAEGPPKFLVRAFVQLQNYVEEKHRDKAGMKKCSKQKAAAINKLQRKLPKALTDFKLQIDQCLENPDDFASEEGVQWSSESEDSSASSDSSSDGESDSDEEEKKSEGGKSDSSSESAPVKAKTKDADSDDSDSDSDSSSSSGNSSSSSSSSSSAKLSSASSSSSSSSSDVEDEVSDAGTQDFEAKHARAMIRWGYKTKTVNPEEKKAIKKDAANKRREEADKRKAAKDKVKEDTPADLQQPRRASLLLPDGGENLDEKAILAKAKEIVAVRGKRGAERQEQLDLLARLCELTHRRKLTQAHLEILNHSITVQLDVTHMATGFPSVAAWRQVCQDISSVFSLLLTHPQVTLTVTAPAHDDTTAAQSTPPQPLDATALTMSFVERLDECLQKAMQNTEAHSKEYKERMGQLIDLSALLWLAWAYYNKKAEQKSAPEVYRTAARIAEHYYYLPDRLASRKWQIVSDRISGEVHKVIDGDFPIPIDNPSGTLIKLCALVYNKAPTTETRVRFRSVLFSIYNRAVREEYWEALDALNASNAYEQALAADVTDQVLYNRCLARVGLAAFSHGQVAATANLLSEICAASKQRELLAQGVAIVKGFEKTAEQEKAERRRLLPPHLHINLDVVESAYNICAMLTEIPQVNSNGRARASRFKRALEAFEKSSTPPESSREFVLSAGRSLQEGDWRRAQELIENMRFWDHLIEEGKAARIKSLLLLKIKEVALQAYVLQFSGLYDSMSIDQLSNMFELSHASVYALISKMIIRKEVSGFWDAESKTLLMNQQTPTELQTLALKLSESIGTCLEQNEMIFSMRFLSATDRPPKKNYQQNRPGHTTNRNARFGVTAEE